MLALLLALAVPATVPVENYVVASDTVAIGGAPSDEALDALRDAGVRAIVDLRKEADAPDAERKAQDRGLTFVRVPVEASTFSSADVDAVAKALEDGPTYLHCATGNRAGAVWAVLAARRGATVEDAIKEGERVGLRSEAMKDAVRRLLSGP